MPREADDPSPRPRPARDAGASPDASPDACAPPRPAAIFFDLGTRDGRRAVEVRSVTAIANGFYASPRATLYSCSYVTQAERIAALRRARLYCEASGLDVVHVGGASDRRSTWQ